MPNDVQLSMRVPSSLIERAKALVQPLADDPRFETWRISQAAVLRLAIAEGLAQLEGRYGIEGVRQRTKKHAAKKAKKTKARRK